MELSVSDVKFQDFDILFHAVLIDIFKEEKKKKKDKRVCVCGGGIYIYIYINKY